MIEVTCRVGRRQNHKLPLHRLAPGRISRDFAGLRDVERGNASRVPQRRQADLVSAKHHQTRPVRIRQRYRRQSPQSDSRMLPMLDQWSPASPVFEDAVEDPLRNGIAGREHAQTADDVDDVRA
jgi:hypothetical protein